MRLLGQRQRTLLLMAWQAEWVAYFCQFFLVFKSYRSNLDGPDECLHMQWLAIQERNLKIRELNPLYWTASMLIFCSGGTHHLCLQRLFAIQISLKRHSRTKDSSCLCSQDMQKCEKHMENYLPSVLETSVALIKAKAIWPQPSENPIKEIN